MLLTLDMGNTNITIGVFDGDRLVLESRVATDPIKMEDQYAVELLDILRLYGVNAGDIDGSIISSVVPPLDHAIRRAVKKVTGAAPLIVGPGTRTGINIRIDNPHSWAQICSSARSRRSPNTVRRASSGISAPQPPFRSSIRTAISAAG